MGKEIQQHHKRTDLFLVRVWNSGNEVEGSEGAGKATWHGKVQRVVDGEAYQFDSLQGLVSLLNEMLPRAEGDGS